MGEVDYNQMKIPCDKKDKMLVLHLTATTTEIFIRVLNCDVQEWRTRKNKDEGMCKDKPHETHTSLMSAQELSAVVIPGSCRTIAISVVAGSTY